MWKQEMSHFLKDFGRGDHGNEHYQKFFFGACSLLAYRDLDTAQGYFRKAGFESVNLIDIDGAQCYIVYNEKTLLILFRGTEPTQLSDVWADMKAWKTKRAGQRKGSIHTGFKKELDKVWGSVDSCIKNNPGKKIYIAGHSLGGAMATLAAARIQRNEDFVKVYTYGAPRVGDRRFVMTCNFTHVRIQNNNDVVCKVPLQLLGYKHMCKSVYINHYGNIRNLTYWQTAKDQWRSRLAAWKKFTFFDGAFDHSMDKYCKKLHKIWEEDVFAHRSNISTWKKEGDDKQLARAMHRGWD